MTPTHRRSWKCTFGLHQWDWRTNPETSDHFEVCLRCDKYREKSSDTSGAAS